MRRSLGARELVGPIIAMTITLAAVYAPIGLQGGLTGSLFREFAFTLAGAVTISGVVALTLSPMMSAKLLKPGIEEHGLAGRIARDFKRIRAAYGRLLDVTLDARPAVYMVWVVVSLLAIPMFIMSPVELAPVEDQGVIFGIFDAAANSTLDQTSAVCGGGQPGVSQCAGNGLHLPDLRFRPTASAAWWSNRGASASARPFRSCRKCNKSCVPSRASGCSR